MNCREWDGVLPFSSPGTLRAAASALELANEDKLSLPGMLRIPREQALKTPDKKRPKRTLVPV
jgi:hypothetical protein